MKRAGGMAWRGAVESCIHGHAFDERNTYRREDGTRVCRACNARIALARYRRLRGLD
jgi:hypothetical protein